MRPVTLTDTNVVLRVLLEEYDHPRYAECCALLHTECVIPEWVFPEVVWGVLNYSRRFNAYKVAIARNELREYKAAPREYTRKCAVHPGWRKSAYRDLRERLTRLLKEYPSVSLYDAELCYATLDIAIRSGHDWVDCALLAYFEKRGNSILSVDSDITKYMEGRRPISFLNLNQ